MSNWNQQNQGGWGNQPPQNQGGFNQQPQQQENFQQQGGYQQQQQPQGENLYVGTGKLVNSQNGRFIKLSFKAEDLQQMLQHVNENGWMSVVLSPRQNPSANGATHYMKIDTWQPNQNQQQGGFQQQQNNGGQQQQLGLAGLGALETVGGTRQAQQQKRR